MILVDTVEVDQDKLCANKKIKIVVEVSDRSLQYFY